MVNPAFVPIQQDCNQRAIALYESEGYHEVHRFQGENAGYPMYLSAHGEPLKTLPEDR